MAKAEASVEELVGKIERGDLKLPEMQREYVWKKGRVRDLLDSLYRGYPSGAILIWETEEDVPTREFSVQTAESPYSATQLLLDGQQRLTSLSAIIRGNPITVRGRKRPIELLFNLDHPEGLTRVIEVDDAPTASSTEEGAPEIDDDLDDDDDEQDATESERLSNLNQYTFIVATNALKNLPNWVEVSKVFKSDSDSPFLRKAGVESIDDPRYDKYAERLGRLRSIRKYVYRMDVLERGLSYEEVTEIFVRVNSLGAKLRASDLALAQITARWKNSLAEFLAFQESCARNGFDLELGVILKALVAFITGQSKFHTVSRIPLEELQKGWEDAKRGIEFSINFLKSNAGIESPALLSSPFMVIAVGIFCASRNYQLSPEENAQLRRWCLLANAKGRYSRGSTETLLDQDLNAMKSGLGVSGLLDLLQRQVGRLEFTSQDLEGRTVLNSAFKTMYIAFAANDARDWESGLKISINHAGTQAKLQSHHVFPRAVLRDRFAPNEINDISNLAFIGARTNQRISAALPEEYLPKLIDIDGGDRLKSQEIPLDPSLFTVDRYRDFLSARRAMIASRLNEFLEVGEFLQGKS